MKERPILFSGPMVRAILAGQKTQTRRLIKPSDLCVLDLNTGSEVKGLLPVRCPYGAPGDRLWVREAHYVQSAGYADGSGKLILYKADGEASVTWTPSIHMYRWASRITLEITGIRVERLNDISEKDCWAEGVEQVLHDFSDVSQCEWANKLGSCIEDAKPLFAQLWSTIHAADGPSGWAANPWVLVVKFRRVDGAN